jgi:hypothetical protein
MKKIIVLVNKSWETEPVVNALTNLEIKPKLLPFARVINSPQSENYRKDKSRAEIAFTKKISTTESEDRLIVSIWCIQDLMYLDVESGKSLDRSTQSTSSSQEKYNVLPGFLKRESPDLVIAVGTAGYPSETSFNGSVIMGGNFFIHNGNSDNPLSRGNINSNARIGVILKSNVNSEIFDLVKDFKNQAENKFLKMQRNEALIPLCMASKVYTAISSINVTDYSEYNWVDHEAITHFQSVEKKLPFKSLETTHGIIKMSSDIPSIFISAITDRLGYFDSEVTPSQNYASSFNAGIALGHLCCSLNDFWESGKNIYG